MSYRQADVPAGPPSGWYLDPGGLQVLRWWDGRQWGSQTQPLPGPMQQPQPPHPDATVPGADGYGALPGQQGGSGRHRQQGASRDEAYAPGWSPGPAPASSPARPPSQSAPWPWAVASAPLVLLGIAILATMLGGPSGSVTGYLLCGSVVAAVFAVFAARRDIRALLAAGDPVDPNLVRWCLLVPWAYLWARAVKRVNKTNADWGLLAGALGACLLVIVISTPVIDSVITDNTTFNQAQVQESIAGGIQSQSGVAVTVSCPQDPPMNPGSQFQCIATAADGTTTAVTVTINDRSGHYTWQTGG